MQPVSLQTTMFLLQVHISNLGSIFKLQILNFCFTVCVVLADPLTIFFLKKNTNIQKV